MGIFKKMYLYNRILMSNKKEQTADVYITQINFKTMLSKKNRTKNF